MFVFLFKAGKFVVFFVLVKIRFKNVFLRGLSGSAAVTHFVLCNRSPGSLSRRKVRRAKTENRAGVPLPQRTHISLILKYLLLARRDVKPVSYFQFPAG